MVTELIQQHNEILNPNSGDEKKPLWQRPIDYQRIQRTPSWPHGNI